MRKFRQYASNLRALERSGAVLARHAQPDDLDREYIVSGVVSKYSIQFELAWKTLQSVLAEQAGLASDRLYGPRPVIKEAFAAYPERFDGELWIEMLDMRNTVIHLYDAGRVEQLAARVAERYVPAFQALEAMLLELYGADYLMADKS